MKKCLKCLIDKPETEFYKARQILRSRCKACLNLENRERHQKNSRSEYFKIYREKNREILKLRSKKYSTAERSRKYRELHPELKDKVNAYLQNKRKNDINFKLRENLRTRLYLSIKKEWKSGSAIKDLGCSIDNLKRYLESKFIEGMSWENYGEWHIDHIKPLSSFDLTKRDEFAVACHYTNLQPLWAKDNIRKGDKCE